MDGPNLLIALLAAALTVAAAVAVWLSSKTRQLRRQCAEHSETVTAQKAQIAELDRDHTFFQTLMNSIPDQIYFKDRESRFLRVNHAVARALGVKTPEEALGKTDADFFAAADAQAYATDDKAVVASAKPLRDRVEHSVIAGANVWLSTTKAPVLDKDGRAVGLVGISRDVTERRQAERALAGVVASARCILWDARVVEKDGDFSWRLRVHRSDLTTAEFGLQTLPGESDGQMWMRHIPAEHHERMKRVSRAALRSGAPGYQQEFRFITANKTELWLKEDVKITRTGPGEYQLVGVCLDVTERRQAENALSEVVASARCILWEGRVRRNDGRYQWRFRIFNSDLTREQFRLQRLPNESDGEMWPRHIPPEQLEKMNRNFDDAIRSGRDGYQQEYMVRNEDNQYLWLKEDVRITRLADDEYHLVGVCLDITDRKVMENELAKERDLLQALMDNIPDSVFFKDAQSRFIRINAHLAYRLGLKSPDEAAGRTDADFYAEDRAKEFLADDQEVLGGKRILNKTEWKLSAGSDRWSLTSKVPFHDRDGKVIGIVGVAKDITPLKRMERELATINERLHKLAREDDLTGLLNRRTILGQMESEWARWQRYKKAFSVLVLDADDFKLINDRYGHLVGDQALKLLADTLRQSVRNVDTVGRYGGEEFIVLLPETGLDGARIAAEKILQNVRSAVLRNNGDLLHMTVSVGAAAVQGDDRNVDAILHRADVALYAAKSAGKNQVAAPTPTEIGS